MQKFTYSPNVSVQFRRESYQGFGETLARSFELVGAPLIFGFAGHFLDRWLGTSPWLLIALSLNALCYVACHGDRAKHFVFGVSFNNRKGHLDVQPASVLV